MQDRIKMSQSAIHQDYHYHHHNHHHHSYLSPYIIIMYCHYREID